MQHDMVIFWDAWEQAIPKGKKAPLAQFEAWADVERPRRAKKREIEQMHVDSLRQEQLLAAYEAEQVVAEQNRVAAEQQRIENTQRQAEEAKNAERRAVADRAQRKARMIADAPKTEINKLCDQWRANRWPELLSALRNRGVFNAQDMGHIERHTIYIGMSEGAARCSWGPAEKINRTITARGTDLQIIYGDTYVYTENGIVTAIQD